jgi:hypothetical protein
MSPHRNTGRNARLSPRSEDGVTLIVTLALFLVTSALIASTLIASVGEVHLSSTASSQKKAYYAAQAGISYYLNHLSQNGAFLTYCTAPPGLASTEDPINQLYKTASGRQALKASELKKIAVAGTSGGEGEFALELIPEQSAPSGDEWCDSARLYETMIEKTGHWAGSFRVKSVGFSGHEKSSIVATFKNEGFLGFVFYDVYETKDPGVYPTTTEITAAEKECGQVYGTRPSWCNTVYFGPFDVVRGAMHTGDHVSVIGSPTFGSESSNLIEFGTAANDKCGTPDSGFSETNPNETACPTPIFKGTHVPVNEVKPIQPPSTDKELQKWGENGGLVLKGASEVILHGTTIRTKTPGTSGTEKEYAWPTDGVVYIANNGSCSEEYHQYATFYPGELSCGNAYVRGTYESSLTIASANDIIVDGNVEAVPNSAGVPTGTAQLGLIAERFVQLYHPVKRYAPKGTSCPSGTTENATSKKCEYENGGAACDAPNLEGNGETENPNPLPGTIGTMANPVIDAAILALNHSFSVDNFTCPTGGPIVGTLTIVGAVAQKFRGIVGYQGGPGYTKAYSYDSRLEAGEPPHFLNPVEATWKLERETRSKSPL